MNPAACIFDVIEAVQAGDGERRSMTSAITATGLRKSFGGKSSLTASTWSHPARRGCRDRRGARPRLLRRHHYPPLLTRFGHWRRRATMIINQSRAVIAATGIRPLASAIERAGGEDTGSEGASR
jgi:hypothetical protein